MSVFFSRRAPWVGRLALASILFVFTSRADATVILEYVGNTFDRFLPLVGPTSPPDPYTTADRITATVELSSLLAPNLVDSTVVPESFALNDGVNTITESSATNMVFVFSTDAFGQISGWQVNAGSLSPGHFFHIITTTETLDRANDILCSPSAPLVCTVGEAPAYAQSALAGGPGVWAYQTSAAPEPTVLGLLGGAVLSVGFLRRRFR